ncbi:heavy-metal-associated domain-containing protein [Neorhodopirellula lusitana]|uniref:heavy-metal-associated domain-containing protein n=1 Tax=Neorhodopirellula lusitana TaxID=445327 RepID=UPI00384C3E4A
MKSIAYVVAGLAALGIMVSLIMSPPSETAAPESAASATSLTSVAADVPAEPLAEAGSMTLEVPGMHCQFACFPKVKETLEGAEGVSEVVLAEQPDPNSLTVKKVIVQYDAGFDVGKALASLKQNGFEASPQL